MKDDVSDGHIELMEEMRNVYIILIGKPERRRPFGRTRSRW
jgi:hypothetical protein